MSHNFHFSPEAIRRAQRAYWDDDAAAYHAAHPEYLDDFYWGPEMLAESQAQLLGSPADLAGQCILEVGCGSAPCAGWLAAHSSAQVFGIDLSQAMLRHFRSTPQAAAPHLVQADARALPYATASMDQVFSVFGAFAFIADIDTVFTEIARVLRPGGWFTFATNHPMRWIFPDDPTEAGLTACYSYFDPHPYAETHDDVHGRTQLDYVEFHRTIGDWVAALTTAGFRITRVIEPPWPDDLDITWGQWSKLRGQIFPGTIIFQAQWLPLDESRP